MTSTLDTLDLLFEDVLSTPFGETVALQAATRSFERARAADLDYNKQTWIGRKVDSISCTSDPARALRLLRSIAMVFPEDLENIVSDLNIVVGEVSLASQD